MTDVSDLIGKPYIPHGRGKDGYDCYGLTVEVLKRMGLSLRDIESSEADISELGMYGSTLNVRKTERTKEGVILAMQYENELHLGVCLDEKSFIHATRNGVRISRIGVFPVINKYEVI